MAAKSGAVAVYIDRKALDKHNLSHIEGMVRETGLIRLAEHDLTDIGLLPWDQYHPDKVTCFITVTRCH